MKGKPALASLRKACVDALLMLLKSDAAALMELEPRIRSGLASLQMEQQAADAVKRRNTYASCLGRPQHPALASHA